MVWLKGGVFGFYPEFGSGFKKSVNCSTDESYLFKRKIVNTL